LLVLRFVHVPNKNDSQHNSQVLIEIKQHYKIQVGNAAAFGKTSEESINNEGHEVRRATVPTSVFLLCATIIGAGILSLPFAFELMGVIFGSIIIIIVGILTAYASVLLMESGIYVNVTSYEVLGDVAFPKYGSWVVAVCIILSNFGSLCAYVVILGDLMHPAILGLSNADPNLFWVNRNVIILTFIVVIILPLCLLRNIAALDKTSIIAVFIASFFCSVIFVRGCMALAQGKVNWDKIVLYDFSSGFFESHIYTEFSLCLPNCNVPNLERT